MKNKTAPWLKITYDYALLCLSNPANKYILKINSRNTRTRRRHLQGNVFDFVLVSSLFSCLYCWLWTDKYLLQTCVIALYLHRSRMTSLPYCRFVNVEHITLSSIVDFEHAFIFWVWSFYISIVFRLRWIKASFMYRKDFHKVKCLYEVDIYPLACFFEIYSKFLNWSE